MADSASDKEVLTGLLAPKPRRRMWIVFLCLAIVVAAVGATAVRASWSPSLPEPTRSSEGVVCGYYDLTDGARPIRCTFIVDRSIAIAKSVVTDYGHFAQRLPYVSTLFVAAQDRSSTDVVGVVHYTPYDHWAFSTKVHDQQGLSDFVTEWNGAGLDFLKNQGSWSLQRIDAQHTRVVCLIDVEVKYIPSVVIKNLLLTIWPQIAEAMKTWVESIPVSSS